MVISVDGEEFRVITDSNGIWNFIAPSETATREGIHSVSVYAVDAAGNRSAQVVIELFNSSDAIVTIPGDRPDDELITGITEEGVEEIVTPSIPLASSEDIAEIIEAVELPGIKTPIVAAVSVGVGQEADIEPGEVSISTIRLSGTSLPDSEVAVYIHSPQAVIYKTETDSEGVWTIDHSQKLLELSPGKHQCFAVALDSESGVKSKPSAVTTFTIKKNVWVAIFDTLNIETTIVALAVILLTMMWLFRVKRKASEEQINEA